MHHGGFVQSMHHESFVSLLDNLLIVKNVFITLLGGNSGVLVARE